MWRRDRLVIAVAQLSRSARDELAPFRSSDTRELSFIQLLEFNTGVCPRGPTGSRDTGVHRYQRGFFPAGHEMS
jgi:hypothetical protein